MRKLLLLLLTLSCVFGLDFVQMSEKKIETLKKEGSGLLCVVGPARNVFIPKNKLSILETLGGKEKEYYVFIHDKEIVIALAACKVAKERNVR